MNNGFVLYMGLTILEFCTRCMYLVINIFLIICHTFTKSPPAAVPNFSSTFNSTTIWILVTFILTEITITLALRIISIIHIFLIDFKVAVLKSTKVFLSCIKDLFSILYNSYKISKAKITFHFL